MVNKKILSVIVSVFMIISLMGCGKNSDSTKMESQNTVQNAIDEQIAKEAAGGDIEQAPAAKVENEATSTDAKKTNEAAKDKTNEAAEDKTNEIAQENTSTNQGGQEATTENWSSYSDEVDKMMSESSSEGVDIDLTSMSSDMIYATVYQLLADAPSYVGKTIKMSGSYYSTWFEDTQQYYHFVLIKDALACCQQGMEFVWDDGSHAYPDEYPENYSEVVVIGTFETYKDNPDDQFEYCRLSNASMEVVAPPEENQ